MILHHLQNSRSQRILWLLEELELSYELKLYDATQARQTNLKFPTLDISHDIVKLLYYPYRILKKFEITHRLICISFILI